LDARAQKLAEGLPSAIIAPDVYVSGYSGKNGLVRSKVRKRNRKAISEQIGTRSSATFDVLVDPHGRVVAVGNPEEIERIEHRATFPVESLTVRYSALHGRARPVKVATGFGKISREARAAAEKALAQLLMD
jgi:hypothetical protein